MSLTVRASVFGMPHNGPANRRNDMVRPGNWHFTISKPEAARAKSDLALTARYVLPFVLLLVNVPPACAQKYEITPFVGARWGGTIKVQDEGQPAQGTASLRNTVSYGVAAGYHFDDAADFDDCDSCGYIGFRWLRQKSNLRLEEAPVMVNPLRVGLLRPPVTMDHFLGDFAHEFPLEDNKMVRPFITFSLGAARMAAPSNTKHRFSFGIGTGAKIFPTRRWGFRFQIEWLPVVMHAEVQTLVCAGGCIIGLGGGLMNQFDINIGPVFRF
jgi:hypothetical protein